MSDSIITTEKISRVLERNKITHENFFNAILLIEKELKSMNIKYRI